MFYVIFMSRITILFLIFSSYLLAAQQDTVQITAELTDDLRVLSVKQKLNFTNTLQEPITRVKLLNWVSSYKNDGTLSRRKLEDRRKDLYFAKESDLGVLKSLIINGEPLHNFDQETIYYHLKKPLQSGEKINLTLDYAMALPSTVFTGYGASEKNVFLKYFFIVPDGFETQGQPAKGYRDIEETQYGGKFWNIHLKYPNGYEAESNLNKNSNENFSGFLSEDPEISVTKDSPQTIFTSAASQPVQITFGYPITDELTQQLEFYLPLQLSFIKEKTGFLPAKIFISEKFKKKEDFFGNDDIKFWKFKFQMFTDAEKADLDYVSIISKKIVNQAFVSDKERDHWLKNGLKTYMEMEYLKKFYPETKLIGRLPEQISLFGFKPLKYLNASKMNLTERYGLTYQYISSQNLDQKIGEPFSKLSNFNDMAISQFETGIILEFLAQKMGVTDFDIFLKDYLLRHRNSEIQTEDFLNRLSMASHYSSDFAERYINHQTRVNFNLKSFKKEGNNLQIRISKNTSLPVPFQITTATREGKQNSYWFDTPAKKTDQLYNIPSLEAEKILVNDHYIFPEKNFRDNYLYTQGIFSNMKKVKLKLLRDVPNPEYNEVYLNPRLGFNAYDKVLIGLNFKNRSLFDQQFLYSFTPYFSTGTNSFTGSGGLSYTFSPVNAFYRTLEFSGTASYFHYDYGLAYRKYGLQSALNFNKNPRSTVSRSLSASYSYYEKDLTELMVKNREYDRYNLWNFGFGYSDSKLIHEIYFGTNLQLMKDFQKIAADFTYRWEYANNKKISFRFFGGYFVNNHTRNNLFDFGISRVSNYAFAYNLIGQSATTGILSQQYIAAEGGFKSYFKDTASHWILSHNVDAHVWKWFNVYADAGVFKNKGANGAKFLYDSGVKVKVIPDFLEIYLPLQSSLGFEPAFSDYTKRIRFTLMLNFSALTNYFRRGWF